MSDIREQKIKMLKKLEGLLELGGFIEKSIYEEFESFFADNVIEAVEQYQPFGKGFCDIAYKVMQASGEYEFRGYRSYISKEKTDELDGSKYQNWIINQLSRLEVEQKINKAGRFWEKWNLSRMSGNVLRNLNVLEERILYLSKGLMNGKKLSVSEIAALPEFSCDKKCIEYIKKYLDEKLNIEGWDSDEFNKRCEEYREKGGYDYE